MDKRILTIILALALIASFFLPLFAHSSASAFDAVKSDYSVSGFENILFKYIWLIFPIAGLMLLIGALNNGNYFLARGLWCVLPLLAVLYIIIRPLLGNDHISVMDEIKALGIAIWVALGASLILSVYNPRRA
jgi:hypothetical protein